MKNKVPYILIALLVITQVYSISKINDLQRQISNINHTVYDDIDGIYTDINSIYSNVDDMLEEQASIIHYADTTVGEIDTDSLTVSVIFTVEPKQVTDTMTVSLKFEDETLELEKEDTTYTGSKTLNMSENEINPNIIIEDNGTKTITQDNGLIVRGTLLDFFPFIKAQVESSVKETVIDNSSEYKCEIDGVLFVDADYDEFNSVKLITKIDDDIISDQDLNLEEIERGPVWLENEYTLKESQALVLDIVAVDDKGFTHEITAYHYTVGSDAQRDPFFDDYKITAADGTVIYDVTQDEKYIAEFETVYGVKP